MARHRRATACAPFSWDVQVYNQPRTARSAQPSSLPTLFPHASICLSSINISCTSMTRFAVMFFPLVVHLMFRCKPPPRPQPPVITTFCHRAALASPRLPPPSPPPPSPQTRPLRTVCMLDDTVGVARIGGDGDKFGLLHAYILRQTQWGKASCCMHAFPPLRYIITSSTCSRGLLQPSSTYVRTCSRCLLTFLKLLILCLRTIHVTAEHSHQLIPASSCSSDPRNSRRGRLLIHTCAKTEGAMLLDGQKYVIMVPVKLSQCCAVL